MGNPFTKCPFKRVLSIRRPEVADVVVALHDHTMGTGVRMSSIAIKEHLATTLSAATLPVTLFPYPVR